MNYKTSKSITILKFRTWNISSLEMQIVQNDNFYQFLPFSGKIDFYLAIFPTPDKKIIWNLENL